MKNTFCVAIKGLNQIINIISSINKGLSDKLKLALPKFKSVAKPTIINEGIFDLYWLVGFIDGEVVFMLILKRVI